LCTELSKDASLRDNDRVRRAADRYHSELRRKALASTTRIYSHAPDDFVRGVKQAWKASRRRSRTHRTRRPGRAAA
jgi:hypothetical protein